MIKSTTVYAVILAAIAIEFIACTADISGGSNSMNERSLSTTDDTILLSSEAIASVRHILGETAITTPDIMKALDAKLSPWGHERVNEWMASLDKNASNETRDINELYENAIDVYGSAAIGDKVYVASILEHIDNPDERKLIEMWLHDGNITTTRRDR